MVSVSDWTRAIVGHQLTNNSNHTFPTRGLQRLCFVVNICLQSFFEGSLFQNGHGLQGRCMFFWDVGQKFCRRMHPPFGAALVGLCFALEGTSIEGTSIQSRATKDMGVMSIFKTPGGPSGYGNPMGRDIVVCWWSSKTPIFFSNFHWQPPECGLLCSQCASCASQTSRWRPLFQEICIRRC